MLFTYFIATKRYSFRILVLSRPVYTEIDILLLQLLGLLLGSLGLGDLGSLGVLAVEVVEESQHGPHVEPEEGSDEEGVAGAALNLHGVHVPGGLDRHHAELGHLGTGDEELDERDLLDAQGRQEVVAVHDNVNERVQGGREVSYLNREIRFMR